MAQCLTRASDPKKQNSSPFCCGAARAKMKKGQITIEYLVLSVVALALLSVSIAILLQITKTSHQAMDNIAFRKSALDLYATVEEVCALGAGNSRTIMIKKDIWVTKSGQDIILENKDIGSIKIELICPYGIAPSGELQSGEVTITAKKDEIEIKNT